MFFVFNVMASRKKIPQYDLNPMLNITEVPLLLSLVFANLFYLQIYRSVTSLLSVCKGRPFYIYALIQVVLVVKNPPVNAGDTKSRVQSLGREDPLEEGMGTHSSTLACRVSWTEKPARLQSIGSQGARHN